MKKVLIFKQSSIGDCLMAIYLLENIRAQYPDVRCGIVVGSRGSMIRDLLVAYPWIEVLETNRRAPRSLWRLWQRFGGADLVVTPYTGGTVGLGTKLVARLLAYRGMLVGYSDGASLNRALFTKRIPLDGKRIAPRTLERQALEAVGVPMTVEWLSYRYIPQPNIFARVGVERRAYMVVHLFSGSIARGLSPNRQQDLLDALAAAFPSMPMLLTGTERERAELAKLQLPTNAKLVATSVQEVATLLDQAAVMVSLGTGTSHIAACLRVPLVVLVNCQGLQWVGQEQWGDAPVRAFCNPTACPNGHNFEGYAACIDSVDMHQVVDTARALADTHV